MSPRQVAVFLLPGVLVLLAAVVVVRVDQSDHLLAAGVAVLLSVPPAFGTFWLTRWLSGRHPLGGPMGMLVGTAVRLVIAVGGGAVAFFLALDLRSMGLAYWVWVLVAYLTTLLAETILLVRTSGSTVAAVPGGKG